MTTTLVDSNGDPMQCCACTTPMPDNPEAAGWYVLVVRRDVPRQQIRQSQHFAACDQCAPLIRYSKYREAICRHPELRALAVVTGYRLSEATRVSVLAAEADLKALHRACRLLAWKWWKAERANDTHRESA